MNLREMDVDSIRDRVARGLPTDVQSGIQGMSLGAAFELACAWVAWRATACPEGLTIMEALSKQLPTLVAIRDLLVRASEGTPQDTFARPSREFMALRSAKDWIGEGGAFFQDRFRRSLAANGFAKNDAYGLSRALGEMADNVFQHSGSDVTR